MKLSMQYRGPVLAALNVTYAGHGLGLSFMLIDQLYEVESSISLSCIGDCGFDDLFILQRLRRLALKRINATGASNV